MIVCNICFKEFDCYKKLSHHIKQFHNINSKQYYDMIYGIGYCKECQNKTKFKNLNIGYRIFCSVKCLNVFKSKDNIFLNKLSISQKGKTKKKINIR